MTVSPFDHPYLSGLLGDEEIASLFSAAAEIAAMLDFETALAKAEAGEGVIPQEAALAIAARLHGHAPDMMALRTAAGTDGVVVPELVRQLRNAVGEPHGRHVHFGATSQDAVDSGLMLRLGKALAMLDGRLAGLVRALDALTATQGDRPLMAHTRMQPAIAVTVADRLDAWKRPLAGQRDRLAALAREGLPLQFGGAAGTLDKLGDRADAVRRALARDLRLADSAEWHAQRSPVAEIAGLLSLVTGSLGKMGLDIALMADRGGEIELSGGGGSSAMPHKQNPVKAEALVTLARFNATLLAGVHQSMVHEQERSGSAWTLEWMLLPQMVVAAGAATRLGASLIGSIVSLGWAGT